MKPWFHRVLLRHNQRLWQDRYIHTGKIGGAVVRHCSCGERWVVQ